MDRGLSKAVEQFADRVGEALTQAAFGTNRWGKIAAARRNC